YAAPALYDNAPEAGDPAPWVPARVAAAYRTTCCLRPMASHRPESDQGRISVHRRKSRSSEPPPYNERAATRTGASAGLSVSGSRNEDNFKQSRASVARRGDP